MPARAYKPARAVVQCRFPCRDFDVRSGYHAMEQNADMWVVFCVRNLPVIRAQAGMTRGAVIVCFQPEAVIRLNAVNPCLATSRKQTSLRGAGSVRS